MEKRSATKPMIISSNLILAVEIKFKNKEHIEYIESFRKRLLNEKDMDKIYELSKTHNDLRLVSMMCLDTADIILYAFSKGEKIAQFVAKSF